MQFSFVLKGLLVLFIVIPNISYSNTSNEEKMKYDYENRIKSLETDVNNISKNQKFQDDIFGKTLNIISSEISASSHNLGIFTFLFGLGGIIMGIYVTYISNKVVKLNEESRLIKEKNETIHNLIHTDINGLYNKIKREETQYMLSRLVKVPEDISNISPLLLSRDLERSDYEKVKQAFLNLPEDSNIIYKYGYLSLLFQHFMYFLVKDEEIREGVEPYYLQYIQAAAFKNDLIKSSEDFIKSIVDMGIGSTKKQINLLLCAISSSKFKDYEEPYAIFFSGLKSRENKFKFYDVISEENIKSKAMFGDLLVSSYAKQDLTESEMLVIQEVKDLKLSLESKKT